ncbi:MAG: hypothetical protein NVSMB12_09020 [Acidimicrobiales bacterium]
MGKLGMMTVAVAATVTTVLGGCGSKTPTRIKVQDGPVGQGNGITPAAMSVPRNANVELTVSNTGTKTHGFSVQGYGVTEQIPAGQTITVKFTANRSGTFKVFCQLHPSHAPSELTVQ